MTTDQVPNNALSAWLALSYSPHLTRAVEIALVGDHSLRVFGHPFDGRRHFHALRRALEQQQVHLSRPWVWRFPCPCGNFGDPVQPCSCTTLALERTKVRAALVAFDLNLDVPRPYEAELRNPSTSEPLELVLARATAARALLSSFEPDYLQSSLKAIGRTHNLHLEQRDAVARVAISIAALSAIHRERRYVSHGDLAEAVLFQTQYRHARSSTKGDPS